MFPRLAEHYKFAVQDLIMSLQALSKSLKTAGVTATCYSCGDGLDGHGASFVAEIGEGQMVRFWFPIAALVGLNPEMSESSSSWKGRKPSTSCNGWPT